MTCRFLPALVLSVSLSADALAYRVRQEHPRLLIDEKRLSRLPALVAGPLSGTVKATGSGPYRRDLARGIVLPKSARGRR
jgi:hypothetical protein